MLTETQSTGGGGSHRPGPVPLPLTRALALRALSCKSAPELARVQGWILKDKTALSPPPPPRSLKYWDTLPLRGNASNLGLGLKSRGGGGLDQGRSV